MHPEINNTFQERISSLALRLQNPELSDEVTQNLTAYLNALTALPEAANYQDLIDGVISAYESVVQHLISRARIADLAYFLTAPPDPKSIRVTNEQGEEELAIEIFKHLHKIRNERLARAISQKIRSSDAPIGMVIEGCMFAGKSDLLVNIADELRGQEKTVHCLTAKVIKKAYIGTRHRGKTDEDALRAAEPVDLDAIETLAQTSSLNTNHISQLNLTAGDTIIIDEAPFICLPTHEQIAEYGGWPEAFQANKNRLITAVQSLREADVHVILAGLSEDLWGDSFSLSETFSEATDNQTVLWDGIEGKVTAAAVAQTTDDIAAALDAASSEAVLNLSAFIVSQDNSSILSATKTLRLELLLARRIANDNLLAEMPDLLWQLGISDINSEIVRYSPQQAAWHLPTLLSYINTELHARLKQHSAAGGPVGAYQKLLARFGIQENTGDGSVDTIGGKDNYTEP